MVRSLTTTDRFHDVEARPLSHPEPGWRSGAKTIGDWRSDRPRKPFDRYRTQPRPARSDRLRRPACPRARRSGPADPVRSARRASSRRARGRRRDRTGPWIRRHDEKSRTRSRRPRLGRAGSRVGPGASTLTRAGLASVRGGRFGRSPRQTLVQPVLDAKARHAFKVSQVGGEEKGVVDQCGRRDLQIHRAEGRRRVRKSSNRRAAISSNDTISNS